MKHRSTARGCRLSIPDSDIPRDGKSNSFGEQETEYKERNIMNRFLWSTWIGLVFLLTGAVMAQNDAFIKVPFENLRNGPSGDKIGGLNAGTKIKILEKQSKWTKIQLTAWVWDESLTTDSTWVQGFKIEVSHILLKTEDDAKSILTRIRQGADFTEMAKQYSIDTASASKGGNLGEFSRGDLVPEFDQAAFRLRVGETSDVVKTPLGYHLIKRTR
jgi:hypothetical protein